MHLRISFISYCLSAYCLLPFADTKAQTSANSHDQLARNTASFAMEASSVSASPKLTIPQLPSTRPLKPMADAGEVMGYMGIGAFVLGGILYAADEPTTGSILMGVGAGFTLPLWFDSSDNNRADAGQRPRRHTNYVRLGKQHPVRLTFGASNALGMGASYTF